MVFYNIIENNLNPYIKGAALPIASSLILSLLIFFSVIIIGRMFDTITSVLYQILKACFGHRLAFFICNYLTLPGIIIHELSHALFVFLTGGKVSKICLLKIGDNEQLGYVNFNTRGNKITQSIQFALSSCAPVIIGTSLIWSLMHILIPGDNLSVVYRTIGWYFCVSIMAHTSMSMADTENYIKGMEYIFPFIYIACLTCRILIQI